MKKIVLKIAIIFLMMMFISRMTYGMEDNSVNGNDFTFNGFGVNQSTNMEKGMAYLEEIDGKYKLVPSYVEGATYSYLSKDPSIASVDENGNITINKPGEVIFFVTRTLPGMPYDQIEEFPLSVGSDSVLLKGMSLQTRENMVTILEVMFAIGGMLFISMYIAYGILVFVNHREKDSVEKNMVKKMN